jgi:hypothetical protein
MSESASKGLRHEAREKEVERKVKAFRRKHIENENSKQVWLILLIYA